MLLGFVQICTVPPFCACFLNVPCVVDHILRGDIVCVWFFTSDGGGGGAW